MRSRSDRQSIIGFTEAELGIFIALLFLGLNFMGRTPPQKIDDPSAVADSVMSQRADPGLLQLAVLARQRDSLSTALDMQYMRDSAQMAQLRALRHERDSLLDVAARARRARGSAAGVSGVIAEASSVAADARRASDSLDRAQQELSRRAQMDQTALATLRQRVDSLNGTLAARLGVERDRGRLAMTRGRDSSASRGRAVASGLGGVADSLGRGRSNQIPTCAELGLAQGEIASLTVMGPNSFRVRGSVHSLAGVLTTLRPELEVARQNGCRQRVVVYPRARLAVEDYVPGVIALRGHFNTDLKSPLPR